MTKKILWSDPEAIFKTKQQHTMKTSQGTVKFTFKHSLTSINNKFLFLSECVCLYWYRMYTSGYHCRYMDEKIYLAVQVTYSTLQFVQLSCLFKLCCRMVTIYCTWPYANFYHIIFVVFVHCIHNCNNVYLLLTSNFWNWWQPKLTKGRTVDFKHLYLTLNIFYLITWTFDCSK